MTSLEDQTNGLRVFFVLDNKYVDLTLNLDIFVFYLKVDINRKLLIINQTDVWQLYFHIESVLREAIRTFRTHFWTVLYKPYLQNLRYQKMIIKHDTLPRDSEAIIKCPCIHGYQH